MNVGSTDRAFRIAVGVLLLAAPLVLDSEARWLGLLGTLPIVTGISRRCPLYALLGLNSCPLTAPPPPT